MAVDPNRNQLLLYGGGDRPNESFHDTWTWNGTTWAKMAVADAPYNYTGGSLAYDPISGRMMLFGDIADKQLLFLQQNAWAANPYANEELPYSGYEIITDKAKGHVLLVGGDVTGPQQQATRAKTDKVWEWTGSDWLEVAVAAQRPMARSNAVAAFDIAGALMLFGGQGQDQYGNEYALDDTWVGRGGRWSQRSPLTTVPKVEAIFVIAVITAKDPPAGTVFQLQLTKPDGSQVTADLCARTSSNPCTSNGGYAWSFEPISSGQAAYRVLYGIGQPTLELTSGAVDLLHTKVYYLEYKG